MKNNLPIIGWREWVSLPELNTPLIKVKIDTGAKTSALHAYDIDIVKIRGKNFVKFKIHPIQRNDNICCKAFSEVIDIRTVKSSSGCKENRIVIRSPIRIGEYVWNIDITLTNRDIMNHRMLLGREAMSDLLINPAKSYCQGFIPNRKAILSYNQNPLVVA
jgi:ribosomal protein S6--L-glutamate ligase